MIDKLNCVIFFVGLECKSKDLATLTFSFAYLRNKGYSIEYSSRNGLFESSNV